MTQKKPRSKPPSGQARKPFPDLDHLTPPKEASPEAQATYFMSLLDAFAQHGTVESKRMRDALTNAVESYIELAKESVDKARLVFTAKMAGIEAGIIELTLGSVRRTQERVLQEKRKVGDRNAQGKKMQDYADGLGAMADAMELLLRASEQGNQELREQASALMTRASDLLGALAK